MPGLAPSESVIAFIDSRAAARPPGQGGRTVILPGSFLRVTCLTPPDCCAIPEFAGNTFSFLPMTSMANRRDNAWNAGTARPETSVDIPGLLERASEAGVFLSHEDGRLHFKLSVGVFPVELKSEIVAHKTDLIAFLSRKQRESGAASTLPALRKFDRTGSPVPLSYAQQRLWFIDQLEGGSAQYNMPGAMRLEGRFDEQLAERALARIIERHEPLRTVFVSGEDGPRQRIKKDFDFRLTRIDLRDQAREMQERLVEEAVDADAQRPFDLSADLMLRASFVRLAEEEGVLLFNMHHIASDGWSMEILVEEFGRLYEALREGGGDPLEPLVIQYADYAQWQREWLKGETLERQVRYWERQLAEAPEVHGLRLDHARPAVRSYRGAVQRLEVNKETVEELKRVALGSQATLYMVLQGAFALLLARHGSSEDVVMGTPVANRGQKELEPLVGFFVNTLVLRAHCGGGKTFRE